MRGRRLGGVAGLAMLVVVLSAPVGLVQAALAWQTETVDSAEDTGWFTSLALDSQNQPHISYFNITSDDLEYATFDGTDWQLETVDTAGIVGYYTSLALDSQNQPHISYNLVIDDDLKYASFDGTSWQIETVDSVGRVGWYTSLALDSTGQPHISYYDFTNRDLKFATFIGLSWHRWQLETIDVTGDVGWYTSLALDSQDRPHISYHDDTNGDLKYATFNGTDWQIEIVDSEGFVGEHASLVLDSQNQPHISYYDRTNQDLKHAAFDGADWQIQIADAAENVGWYTSLALDSQDLPRISYFDVTNTDLKYAESMDNAAPTVEAGDPYSGEEGSPVTLQGTVNDPEDDDLSTTWSYEYEVDSADPGTTCTFGDASQLETAFTCDDDGTFTVTLEADDGINPAVSNTATVTITNVAPSITDATANVVHNEVLLAVTASDPGASDVLSYAFDCNNDEIYEVDAGTTSSTSCPFNPQQEGNFAFGVQVSDDDGGSISDTATVTIPTELCSSNYTGVVRYSDSCRSYETAITILGPEEKPVTVCASIHNGLLRAPANGVCTGHEITYELPEDGPLNVCVNSLTQTMRTVDDLSKCASHEFGQVIAATEVGELPPPRSH